MKHITARLTSAMLLVSLLVTPSFALTGVINAEGGVRMRKEASTDSEALASLPDGAEVKILESMTGWYKVSNGGKTGYVASDYLKANEESAAKSDAPASSQKSGLVKEDGVRMRKEASTDSEVLASFTGGTKVTVLETLTDWYKVSYKDQTGYIASDYLTVEGASASTPKSDAPASTPKSDETSSPAKTEKPASTQKTQTALAGIVKEDGVRLRAEASTDSEVLKNLSNGTQVEILESLTDWYKVSYKGQTGYIASDYLEQRKVGTYVQIADGPLNIRSAPDTESKKVGSVGNGKVVEVEKLENGWYKIADGYISAEYVVPCDDPDRQGSAAYVKVEEGPLNVRSEPDTGSKKVSILGAGEVVQVKGLVNGWYRTEDGYISADYVVQSSSAEAKKSAPKAQSSSSGSSKQSGGGSSVAAPQGGAGSDIARYALQFVGYPYVYGGSSPRGFDCSGFTSYVYRQFGYSLSRTASGQLDHGRAVSRGELAPGDLVIFKKGSSSKRATHVGLYIGNNQFVHASTSKTGVIISNMNSSYYATGLVGARRIVG